jgi:hypothetical protein
MLILKRLAVWSLERLVEVSLLGGLFGCLLSLSSGEKRLTLRDSLAGFWVLGLAVAIVLFLHGYYVTTAFFGVVWRSAKTWVYPTITPALFVFHTHIVFMRLGSDFTPEARAMELPFALGGAGIVFFCALAGSSVLNRWTNARSETNAYLYKLGITTLVFMLANTAHFLRPVVGNIAFRTYGLPFTFYREGGFIKEWMWQPGALVWRGMVADVAVIAAVVLLLGRAWQTVRARCPSNE